jgi:hypothetical protein
MEQEAFWEMLDSPFESSPPQGDRRKRLKLQKLPRFVPQVVLQAVPRVVQ